MAKVKMLLIDVDNCRVKEVEVDDYHDYLDHLGCEIFDVTVRRVGEERRPYEFIVDDMGLFKESPIASAISSNNEVMLVGNILIAGNVDHDGDFTDLSEDDLEYIKKYIKARLDFTDLGVIPILTQCNY